MRLDDINIFGEQTENKENNSTPDDPGFDCPIVDAISTMYLEPHPYGVTISMESTEELLKSLGYTIVTKKKKKYALKNGEKLLRGNRKEEQSIFSVYRRVSEKLAIGKFLKDWKDVFGTDRDS